MNLHSIVAPCIAAINPMVTGQYQQSSGYATAADGSRSPAFAAAITVNVQRQPMTFKDLQQVSGLNLNGERAAFFVTGNLEAVSRPDQRGGDVITLADGSIWLVVQPLENWAPTSGWVKVAVVRQES